MQATPETVRRVLRSWLATEVLTPQVTRNGWSGLSADKQGQQRNKMSTTADDPGLWAEPGDDDPPPWPLRAEPSESDGGNSFTVQTGVEDEPRPPKPWYFVVLGALPAREAFFRLDAAFAENADEDETNRRTQGNVIGACAVLDEWVCWFPTRWPSPVSLGGWDISYPAARHRISPRGTTTSRTSRSASAVFSCRWASLASPAR